MADPTLQTLKIPHQTHAPLGPRTWYKVGGHAQCLAMPASVDQLASILTHAHEHHLPVRVLGRGANLLVRDTIVPGIVVSLEHPAFSQVTVADDQVTAGAGCDLFKLVQHTARLGLAGLEVLAGIPASIGGAIRMNAGGAFGEIGSVTASIRTITHAGEIRTLDHQQIGFAYRQTRISEPIILDATFRLTRAEQAEVRKRVKEIFAYKKNSQPMGDDSAGCAFKNPPADVGKTAGQLIDQAGLKGFAIGQARVSTVHANFVVTEKDKPGCADDIHAVIQHVQKTVREKFGIELQREVVVWP